MSREKHSSTLQTIHRSAVPEPGQETRAGASVSRFPTVIAVFPRLKLKNLLRGFRYSMSSRHGNEGYLTCTLEAVHPPLQAATPGSCPLSQVARTGLKCSARIWYLTAGAVARCTYTVINPVQNKRSSL